MLLFQGIASPCSGDYIAGAPPVLIDCQLVFASGLIGVIIFFIVFYYLTLTSQVSHLYILYLSLVSFNKFNMLYCISIGQAWVWHCEGAAVNFCCCRIWAWRDCARFMQCPDWPLLMKRVNFLLMYNIILYFIPANNAFCIVMYFSSNLRSSSILLFLVEISGQLRTILQLKDSLFANIFCLINVLIAFASPSCPSTL